jgi:hypothetical protein
VAGVKEVEDAVREHDSLSGASQVGGQARRGIPGEDGHLKVAPPLKRHTWRGR